MNKSTHMKPRNIDWLVALAILILVTPAFAQDTGTPDTDILENTHPQRPYSPYAGGAIQVFEAKESQGRYLREMLPSRV